MTYFVTTRQTLKLRWPDWTTKLTSVVSASEKIQNFENSYFKYSKGTIWWFLLGFQFQCHIKQDIQMSTVKYVSNELRTTLRHLRKSGNMNFLLRFQLWVSGYPKYLVTMSRIAITKKTRDKEIAGGSLLFIDFCYWSLVHKIIWCCICRPTNIAWSNNVCRFVNILN